VCVCVGGGYVRVNSPNSQSSRYAAQLGALTSPPLSRTSVRRPASIAADYCSYLFFRGISTRTRLASPPVLEGLLSDGT